MDPELKSILRGLSLKLRHLLEGYYDEEGRWHPGDLERRLNEIGIWRNRDPKPVDELPHLSEEDLHARKVVEAYLQYRKDAGVGVEKAVAEFVRESAYTWANRLLALRCMEARDLIDEVILQKEVYGWRSLQHNRLARKHPELCAGEDDGLFVVLFQEFEQMAEELPQLFNPRAVAIALRPSVATLKKCIVLLSGKQPANGEVTSDLIFEAPDAFGWAYQYWNSEEKDRVFEKIRTKRGAKIEGAEIIPTTCIYTEPYMVKFLVQNSLGALWLGMHPDTSLCKSWQYYVRDADRAPVKRKPVREITFLDPACGSGHFLIEAFDLFYEMYLEEGEVMDRREICASIVERNLYGLDIDERAVQIARLALVMKAKEKVRDFVPRRVNIVATNIRLSLGKDHLKAFLGKHPEDAQLKPALLKIFEGLAHADELGSLLQIEEPVERELRFFRSELGAQRMLLGPHTDEEWETWRRGVVNRLREHFTTEEVSADLVQSFFSRSVGKGLVLFDLLARCYDVVATNPPYMGSRNIGPMLKEYIGHHYKSGKHDLYSAFILRCRQLAAENGWVAMVTQHSWMFLRSFTNLRALSKEKIKEGMIEFTGLLHETMIETLAHLGANAFSEISGEVVSVVLFTIRNAPCSSNHHITAYRLVGERSSTEKAASIRTYTTSQTSLKPLQTGFLEIEASPLSYWLTDKLITLLSQPLRLGKVVHAGGGVGTRDENRFLRKFWEVDPSVRRWRSYAKGGLYQKWEGLLENLVDWEYDGRRVKESIVRKYPYLSGNYGFLIRDEEYHFQPGLTYTDFAQGSFSCRRLDNALFSDAGPGIFAKDVPREGIAAWLNTHLISYLLRSVSPSFNHFGWGYVLAMPIPPRVSLLAVTPLAKMACTYKSELLQNMVVEQTFHNTPTCKDSVHILQTFCIAAILHALEGLIEMRLLESIDLGPPEYHAIKAETGKPADWYPLIKGYDSLPSLPANLVAVPRELVEYITSRPRITYSCEQLSRIKDELGMLYRTGPEGTIKQDRGGGSLHMESSQAENEEGKSSVSAYIPFPPETFLEEISQKLEIHPISVYWLLKEGIAQEGWYCLPEHRRIATCQFVVTILRLLGHRWPKQMEAKEPMPSWVDPDGIIPLTKGTSEPTLLDRVRERIMEDNEVGDVTAYEHEFAEIMGKSLDKWLTTEFFKRHTKLFKKRPIAWQLESRPIVSSKRSRGRRRISEGVSGLAFSCIVYSHRLDDDLLPKIRSQYVGPLRRRYETELRTLENIQTPAANQTERRLTLENLVQELKEFDGKLEEVITNGFDNTSLRKIVAKESLDKWTSIDGKVPPPSTRDQLYIQEKAYNPDLNDGVRVNIAPLQKAGLLAADVLSKKDLDRAISDRAEWRADARRWCREGKLPQPGWWKTKGENI